MVENGPGSVSGSSQLPQHPSTGAHTGFLDYTMRATSRSAHDGSSDSDAASFIQVISPDESGSQSRESGATAFWDRLFEEEASIRVKREREVTPGSDDQSRQGRESITYLHG